MFRWIWNKLFSKRQEPLPNLFTPTERNIYRYGVGWDARGRVVFRDADPMALWKRLMDKGPEVAINIKVAESPSRDARKCHTALVEQIREIFQLPKAGEGGVAVPLDEINCTGLLDSFLIYTGGVKKNIQTSATSSGATPSDTPDTSGESSPTKSTSGSGSTDSDSSTATPPPSPSASASPSGSSTPGSNTSDPSPTGTAKPSG